MKPLVYLTYVLIFAAALAAASVAIHQAAPFPNVPILTPKLERFALRKDEITTLFIGSSCVYQQISPAIFDEVANAHGIESTAFNFGVNGMTAPETFHVLGKILEMKPAKLKWLFYEVVGGSIKVEIDQEDSVRNTYWRGWRETSVILRVLKNHRRLTPQERLHLGTRHLVYYVKNIVNLGRGPEIATKWWKAVAKSSETWLLTGKKLAKQRRKQQSRAWKNPHPELGPNQDGYRPSHNQLDTPEKVQQFEAALAKFAQPAPERGNPVFWEELHHTFQSAKAIGTESFILVPPTTDHYAVRPQRAWDAGISSPIWNFNNPTKYPVLFEHGHRQDRVHLNAQGADIYTRLLAQRFVTAMKKKETAAE
jgi:hypothetical protein